MTTWQPAVRVRVGVQAQLPRSLVARVTLSSVALAWIALVLLTIRPPTESAAMIGPAHVHMTHHVTTGVTAPWSVDWVGHWVIMVIAMMWPLALPTVATVGRVTFRGWRLPFSAAYLGTVTVLWLAGGLALASVAQLARVPAGSRWWQLAGVAAAVIALCSARRARLLSRCARLGPLAPAGRRGLLTSVHAGLVSWRRCALLCGPAMGAMVVGHAPVIMVCASASAWWEATHSRAWRDPVPFLLLGAAAVWTVAALTFPEVVGRG